jgi:hypothetical protein
MATGMRQKSLLSACLDGKSGGISGTYGIPEIREGERVAPLSSATLARFIVQHNDLSVDITFSRVRHTI